MDIIIEEAKKRAIAVIEHCQKPTGFYASGLPGGYEATWARDSMITSLGACLVENRFKTPFKKSLELLAKYQSELGQIPNAVGSYNTDRRSDVTYNSVDSTLWYIIGHYVYAAAYGDKTLMTKYKKNLEKAYAWLRYQDPNEVGLLAQHPTMDWQDAFPHKYGHVLSTQALYYAVLKMSGQQKHANRIKRVINGKINKYLSLYDAEREYYLPWAWKNHDGDRETEYWFDSLGNLLTIVLGLADLDKSRSILNYIEAKKINRPYPVKSIFPPIFPKSKSWKSYFSKCEARTPYHYLNAGIWPFIGGFYVASLVKAKQFAKAEEELKNLAWANKQGKKLIWEFNEWLDGKKGKPLGCVYQAWSAGAYLFAHESVKNKQVPFF